MDEEERHSRNRLITLLSISTTALVTAVVLSVATDWNTGHSLWWFWWAILTTLILPGFGLAALHLASRRRRNSGVVDAPEYGMHGERVYAAPDIAAQRRLGLAEIAALGAMLLTAGAALVTDDNVVRTALGMLGLTLSSCVVCLTADNGEAIKTVFHQPTVWLDD